MAESNSFTNLKNQYFLLDRNFNRTFASCTNENQRNKFRADYVTARDNFWEARTRIFIDNEPLVKQINIDIKKANDEITNMLSNLQNVVKLLDTINAGVKLGSSLITLGSTSA